MRSSRLSWEPPRRLSSSPTNLCLLKELRNHYLLMQWEDLLRKKSEFLVMIRRFHLFWSHLIKVFTMTFGKRRRKKKKAKFRVTRILRSKCYPRFLNRIISFPSKILIMLLFHKISSKPTQLPFSSTNLSPNNISLAIQIPYPKIFMDRIRQCSSSTLQINSQPLTQLQQTYLRHSKQSKMPIYPQVPSTRQT